MQHNISNEEREITRWNYDTNTNLTINARGATDNIDFERLPIKDCILNLDEVGLGTDFSSPTARPTDQVGINGEGVNISISNIGNTDFKRLNLLRACNPVIAKT